MLFIIDKNALLRNFGYELIDRDVYEKKYYKKTGSLKFRLLQISLLLPLASKSKKII